jgi:hypothetical protein
VLAVAAIREAVALVEATLAEVTLVVIQAAIPGALGGAVVLIPAVEVPREAQEMGGRTSKMIRECSPFFASQNL